MNKAQADKIWYYWSKLCETAPARFAKYGSSDRSELDDSKAGNLALEGLAKIAWNTALAEALTPVLQATEIALRNWMDKAIAEHLAGSHPNPVNWLMNPPAWVHRGDRDLIEDSVAVLEREIERGGRAVYGHNDIVATTSLSLWTGMIQNNEVWSALSSFRSGNLTKGSDRKTLHKVFDEMRNIRNRAYHLEPIFCEKDIWTIYSNAKQYLSILEPRLALLTAYLDRFPLIYDSGGGWKAISQDLYAHYGLDELEESESA